jgi:hypothetical protein
VGKDQHGCITLAFIPHVEADAIADTDELRSWRRVPGLNDRTRQIGAASHSQHASQSYPYQSQ